MRAHITKKTSQGGFLGCSRGPPLWILLSSLLHFEVTLPLSVCPKGFSGSLFARFGPQFAAPGVAFLAYLSETILYCGTSCRAECREVPWGSGGRSPPVHRLTMLGLEAAGVEGCREGAYDYIAHPPFPLPWIDASRLHA